jgi:Icc-related predicted phosphoesterase
MQSSKALFKVLQILSDIKFDEYLEKYSNTIKNKRNFILICGDLTDETFNICIDNDFLRDELEINGEGDNIEAFKMICIRFREKYKESNITTFLIDNTIEYNFIQ